MLKNWYAICDNDWLFEKKIKSELQLLLYVSKSDLGIFINIFLLLIIFLPDKLIVSNCSVLWITIL